MRPSLFFFAGSMFLAAACGGQTGGLGGGGDAGPEASSSSGSGSGGTVGGSSSGSTGGSSGSSTGGSSSGAGVCEPLQGCDSSVECPGPTPCSTCECYAGTWSCNTLDCPEGGTLDAYDPCPTYAPPPGTSCGAVGAACFYYPDAGCGNEECDCEQPGFWACGESVCLDSGPPDSGFPFDAGEICPGTVPNGGQACNDEGNVCTYFNGCETNCLCASGAWVCAQQEGCISADF
jgi:hypothetical protein